MGDRAGEGTTLNNLGELAADQGRAEEAARYYEQALAIRREVGDRAGEGATLNNLGALADDQGRAEEAARYYEQALAIRREVGDRAGEGTTLNNLGGLAATRGASRKPPATTSRRWPSTARWATAPARPPLCTISPPSRKRSGSSTTLSGPTASRWPSSKAIGAEPDARGVRGFLDRLEAGAPAAPASTPASGSLAEGAPTPASTPPAASTPAASTPATSAVPAAPGSPPEPTVGEPQPVGAEAKQRRRWWRFGR